MSENAEESSNPIESIEDAENPEEVNLIQRNPDDVAVTVNLSDSNQAICRI